MDNFNLRKYLIENQLTHSSIKLNEVSIDMIKTQYVDTKYDKDGNKDENGKPLLDKETFEDIKKAAQNKSAYVTWLAARVGGTKKFKHKDTIIKKEDIEFYKKYLDIFDRRKQEYPIKDIGGIKTKDTLDDFLKISKRIADEEGEDISQQKGVSKTEKYTKLKLGEVDGYEIFKFPKGSKELYGASCELGSGTDWCTATGRTDDFFQDYISQGNIYVIISKNNPRDKYQFHYETGQFMDRSDRDIFER